MEADLLQTNFDNQHFALANTANTYLEKHIDVDNELFGFEKSIKI